MALIGFGTQQLHGEEGKRLFQYAYDIGYRLFDTALAYGNLDILGESITAVGRRESMRLVSKIALPDIEKYTVRGCVEKILGNLRTDYIDVLFIHAPKGVNHKKVYMEMLELKDEKKIVKCGVSNYTVNHIHMLTDEGIDIEAVQIEIHPFLAEFAYTEFCQVNNIEIMAHTALANGRVFKNSTLIKIAEQLNCTIGQLVLSWTIAKNISPIMSSKNPCHLKTNFDIISLANNGNISELIDKLDENLRICNNPSWAEFNFKYTK